MQYPGGGYPQQNAYPMNEVTYPPVGGGGYPAQPSYPAHTPSYADSQHSKGESKLRSTAEKWATQGLGQEKAVKAMEAYDMFVEAADIQSSEGTAYIAFLVIMIGSAFFVSEPHVGLLYMMGSAFQILAMILLLVKVHRDKNASGVSVFSLAAVTISTGFRVRAMLHGAYIPLDALGGNIYICMQGIITCLIAFTIALCFKYGRAQEAISGQAALITCVICLVMAQFIHPDLDETQDTLNVIWVFGKYLEAVDMWPYLALAVQVGQMESFSVHFIVCMFISRCFVGFVFFTCYSEFGYKGNLLSGYLLFLSHIVQLVILGDFIVHYVRGMMNNAKSVFEDGMIVNI